MNKLQVELVKLKKAIEKIALRNGFDYVGMSIDAEKAYICLFINSDIVVSGYVPTSIKGAKQVVRNLIRLERNSKS